MVATFARPRKFGINLIKNMQMYEGFQALARAKKILWTVVDFSGQPHMI
jgi:hypothetical protein